MTTRRTSTAASGAATTAALQLDYLSCGQIASQSASWWRNVLGIVGFERLPIIDGARAPIAASMTPFLGVNGNLCEVWRVDGPQVLLANGAAERSRVHYRFCEDLLFGSITLEERSIEAEGPSSGRADQSYVL